MSLFEFHAKCRFKARDLDEAFQKLEQHFKALREGGEANLGMIEGEMNLYPVKKKDD